MSFKVNTLQTICPGVTHLEIESLAPHVVFMLLSVAFSAAGQPSIVPLLVNELISQYSNISDKIQWIEYTRCGIMKSSVLCGIPKIINAETALYNGLALEYQALLRTVPLNQNGDPSVWNKRGEKFFNKVYGDQYQSKLDGFYSANPDMGYFIDEVYGNLVSDTTYLSEAETELEVIVTLSMVDSTPQLKDHLIGAANVGASPGQIRDAQNVIKTVQQCISKMK